MAKKRRPRPATTPEGRENQMIALAVDLAEQQILDGTASAAVLTHYLKMGTAREQLEREKLRRENTLLEAKAESLASAARIEELYSEAMKSMQAYRGEYQEPTEEFDED